jgi:hypothetical protein
MGPAHGSTTTGLQDYRDPGHFAGKGWIQLEFTGLILAGGSVPMNAKVISAASYRVNGEGKIQGRGHAMRDAIEWSIPILWPIKVLTLPARSPRPVFGSETRIELRGLAGKRRAARRQMTALTSWSALRLPCSGQWKRITQSRFHEPPIANPFHKLCGGPRHC